MKNYEMKKDIHEAQTQKLLLKIKKKIK